MGYGVNKLIFGITGTEEPYFIDVDDSIAEKKAREKYPTGWLVTFRINETGACGRI